MQYHAEVEFFKELRMEKAKAKAKAKELEENDKTGI